LPREWPLLEAVHAGRLAFAEAGRAWRPAATLRALDRTGKPALLLLGDDDETPTGPAGWPGVATALRWARAVVLHATGGLPEHGPEWLALARPSPARPMLLILPPSDDVHPRPTGRGRMQ
jgi:hypothetical protein